MTNRFPAIIAELPARADAIARLGAEVVERRTKLRAPDRPPLGEGLVEAIHTERRGVGEYEVMAGDGQVFWGHFVEFGHTGAPPHPFMVPAAEESRGDVRTIATSVLRGL
jgi:HK97 gp10 family phage protein